MENKSHCSGTGDTIKQKPAEADFYQGGMLFFLVRFRSGIDLEIAVSPNEANLLSISFCERAESQWGDEFVPIVRGGFP